MATSAPWCPWLLPQTPHSHFKHHKHKHHSTAQQQHLHLHNHKHHTAVTPAGVATSAPWYPWLLPQTPHTHFNHHKHKHHSTAQQLGEGWSDYAPD